MRGTSTGGTRSPRQTSSARSSARTSRAEAPRGRPLWTSDNLEGRGQGSRWLTSSSVYAQSLAGRVQKLAQLGAARDPVKLQVGVGGITGCRSVTALVDRVVVP